MPDGQKEGDQRTETDRGSERNKRGDSNTADKYREERERGRNMRVVSGNFPKILQGALAAEIPSDCMLPTKQFALLDVMYE